MIKTSQSKLHWNYFLALERDLETVARYIEFAEPNFGVYSIELAHLIFAAASEVDVVAKLICEEVAPGQPKGNIAEYRTTLLEVLPDLPTARVTVARHGLVFAPWDNWAVGKSPHWWTSYNHVKHERDAHFSEATLKNALNALGALLIMNYHYYSYSLCPDAGQCLGPKDTTLELVPESTMLRLEGDYYYDHLIV